MLVTVSRVRSLLVAELRGKNGAQDAHKLHLNEAVNAASLVLIQCGNAGTDQDISAARRPFQILNAITGNIDDGP